jgi:hypothetical protein
VHGFKYGDRWRAEFNYPGNVKPRSTNKICANFFRQIVSDRDAQAASMPATSGPAPIGLVDRADSLQLAISPGVA